MMAQPETSANSWDECIELLDRLPTLDQDARREALERLIRNPSPGIRSRALRMGAALLSDDQIKAYLRSDADDVIRNAGVEMLKMRGNRGFSLATKLLADEDGDIVLQAVLTLKALRDPRALEPLRAALHHQDPNVVQEAIVAIGELGDARAIPDLLGFLEADPWLQMAAVQALGYLRSPVAVRHLEPLLTDLLVGPMSAEALARIGGREAFETLLRHWLRFVQDLDTETTVGLLAHVLEGLPNPPDDPEPARQALAPLLEHGREPVRISAARGLLCLGTGPEDRRALTLVAGVHREPTVLPACLHHRHDLIAELIQISGSPRTWGFLLAERYPDQTPIPSLVRALERSPLPDEFPPMVRALDKIRDPALGKALLGFYLRQPDEQRSVLHRLLAKHRAVLLPQLQTAEIDSATAVVLAAVLGEDLADVVARLTALPHGERARVLAELTEHDAVMQHIPWNEWLGQAPMTYGPVAAAFASRTGLRELAPSLRALLTEHTEAYLIRTLGELGDRESVSPLIQLLDPLDSPLEPIVLESLGRIGGPQARAALRNAADSVHPRRARMAYRGLARCAVAEDDATFRDAINHSDWYIRLSCAEVLGRFSRPENLAALAQLAADPIPIVAQRALSFLET